MNNSFNFHKHKVVFLFLLAGLVVLLMGCKLFSMEYWTYRLDTGEETLPTETSASGDSPTGEASQFGVRCLDSPGDKPCPIEACVVTPDQFSATYEITSELYGKANPSNFSCCAGYRFDNKSNKELLVLYHWNSESEDGWGTRLITEDDNTDTCGNYYSQHEGKVTYTKGVTEVVVLYANAHCDWIESDDPGLKKYVVPVLGPCAAQ